jgi:ATP-dependent protease ClpP protease subunit
MVRYYANFIRVFQLGKIPTEYASFSAAVQDGRILSTKKVMVYLDSPGGLLVDGAVIADIIHGLKMNTYVDADVLCASMCANIWLAGNVRYVNSAARIGFHTISKGDKRDERVNELMLHDFYRAMGVSDKAARVFLAADSDDVMWLTAELAKALDIKIKVWPEPEDDKAREKVDPEKIDFLGYYGGMSFFDFKLKIEQCRWHNKIQPDALVMKCELLTADDKDTITMTGAFAFGPKEHNLLMARFGIVALCSSHPCPAQNLATKHEDLREELVSMYGDPSCSKKCGSGGIEWNLKNGTFLGLSEHVGDSFNIVLADPKGWYNDPLPKSDPFD